MPFHKCLIIVPTHNVVKSIEQLSKEILGVLRDTEVLFVDSASSDGTFGLLDTLADNESNIHSIQHESGSCLGSAYLRGFEWGLHRNFDYLVTMSSGGEHHPRYLTTLLNTCIAGADVAVASRFVKGGGTKGGGGARKLLSKSAGLYSRRILGVDVKDMASGFTCWSRVALKTIDLANVRSDGYGFHIEMKYRAFVRKLSLKEVPVIFERRVNKRQVLNQTLVVDAFVRLLQLRLGK